jgi:hypothetical protein
MFRLLDFGAFWEQVLGSRSPPEPLTLCSCRWDPSFLLDRAGGERIAIAARELAAWLDQVQQLHCLSHSRCQLIWIESGPC